MSDKVAEKIKNAISRGGLTKGLFLDNGVMKMSERGVTVALINNNLPEPPERLANFVAEKKEEGK